MVFGTGQSELEDAVSWLTLVCSSARLRCEFAEARYISGHRAYMREAELLFQARADAGGRVPGHGRLARDGLVGCGLCSGVGRWTRAEAGAHLCTQPPLMPGIALRRVSVIFPEESVFTAPSRASAPRLVGLRNLTVLLYLEHCALVALDGQLLTLATALTDTYFATNFERCVLIEMGPQLWIHGFRPAWRCRRGCAAGPEEWPTHVCPRIADFEDCVVSHDDYRWDATRVTLERWTY
jgi:hypothetical protein